MHLNYHPHPEITILLIFNLILKTEISFYLQEQANCRQSFYFHQYRSKELRQLNDSFSSFCYWFVRIQNHLWGDKWVRVKKYYKNNLPGFIMGTMYQLIVFAMFWTVEFVDVNNWLIIHVVVEWEIHSRAWILASMIMLRLFYTLKKAWENFPNLISLLNYWISCDGDHFDWIAVQGCTDSWNGDSWVKTWQCIDPCVNFSQCVICSPPKVSRNDLWIFIIDQPTLRINVNFCRRIKEGLFYSW